MNGLDAAFDLLREPVPHDGYREGEIPQYRDCVNCQQQIRADRSDLIAEHNQVCSNPLTARELEVLQLIADGYTNDEIARALLIGLETIKTHIRHMLRKWRTPCRASAVAIAFRQGLIR